jgi:hypothetical protein
MVLYLEFLLMHVAEKGEPAKLEETSVALYGVLIYGIDIFRLEGNLVFPLVYDKLVSYFRRA